MKPAPPVDSEIPDVIPEDDEQHRFSPPDGTDQEPFKIEVEEIDEQGNVVHDEL